MAGSAASTAWGADAPTCVSNDRWAPRGLTARSSGSSSDCDDCAVYLKRTSPKVWPGRRHTRLKCRQMSYTWSSSTGIRRKVGIRRCGTRFVMGWRYGGVDVRFKKEILFSPAGECGWNQRRLKTRRVLDKPQTKHQTPQWWVVCKALGNDVSGLCPEAFVGCMFPFLLLKEKKPNPKKKKD